MKHLKLFLFISLPYLSISAVDNNPPPSPVAFENPSMKLVEYARIFQSHVFDDYLSQLRAFVHQETQAFPPLTSQEGDLPKQRDFYRDMAEFLNLLKRGNPQTAEEKRAFHSEVLFQLRSLLERKDDNCEAAGHFLNRLCWWMYTQPRLSLSYWHLLQLFGAPTSSLDPTLSDFILNMERLYTSLKEDERLTGYYPPSSTLSDVHYFGQLPSALYSIKGAQVIHTARTLIEDKAKASVTVSPEFKAYLEQLKREKKTHLYVNLMNRQKDSEKQLSKALEALEEDTSVGHIITVVTLDKDSSFYWQEEEYAEISEAAQFKDIFFDQLFAPKERALFKWSNKQNLEKWKKTCRDLLDWTHHTYFSDCLTLSVSERQAFIEIILIQIIETLIEQQRPTYCNISCKHTVDRGPSLLGLLYVSDFLQTKQEWKQEQEKLVFSILFAPPLLTRNRPPHDYRLKRVRLTLEHLAPSSLSIPLPLGN